MSCRILVPWPGIEPRPFTGKVPIPNHCTAREFPTINIFKKEMHIKISHIPAWTTPSGWTAKKKKKKKERKKKEKSL